jgi:hypothetical protein
MITFKYIPQATHVAVTTEEQGRQITKQIPYTDIVDFFGAQKVSRKDSGYIGTNLIREVILESRIKRLFHYPELTVALNFAGNSVDTISQYLIPNDHFKVHSVGNRHALNFPAFKFKNILGFIISNNNASRNFISYNVCFAEMTGLSLNVTDETKYHKSVFNNHYSDKICWPHDIADTAQAVLNSTSPADQAGFVRLYLSSLFNTDLDPNVAVGRDLVNSTPGFKDFLQTVFRPDFFTNEAHLRLNEMSYIYMYYQYNVLPSPSQNFLRNITRNELTRVGRFFQ